MTSALSTCSKCVVAAAFAAVLAVLGSPTGGVRAEDRSPVIDFSSGNAEMNAAIAKARATLPTFWASYDAPKPSETGHSLKVRFPNPRNSGEHIWMAEVKKIADGRYSGQVRQRAARFARQAGRRHGRVQGGRHLGLDVHAERQDRRRRDHQAAAENDAEGRRRRASRADGNPLRETQGQGGVRTVPPRSQFSVIPGHDEVCVGRATRLPGRVLAGTNAPHG